MAKRYFRAPIAAFALLLAAASLASQDPIPPEQAKSIARRVASILGGNAKFGENAAVDFEHVANRPGAVTVRVSEPGTSVVLDQQGLLRSYSHTANIVGSQGLNARREATDEANWSALEAKLTALRLPHTFRRIKFKRVKGNEKRPDALRFMLEMLPFGYRADPKAEVFAWMGAASGEVFALNLTTGWDYEGPKVRVSYEEAIAQAIRIYGGEPADWKYSLTYEADASEDAPSEIRELTQRRIQRLCYNLYSAPGSVLVDSVTGEVLFYGSPFGPSGRPSRLERLGAPKLLAIGAALVLIVGGVVLLARRLRAMQGRHRE